MNAGDIDLQLCGRDERRALGMAAAAAFKKVCADDPAWLPEMKQITSLSASRLQEDWRHRMVKQFTAGRALRIAEIVQRDFNDVLGGFADLAGQPAEAFKRFLRAASSASADESPEAKRQWLAKCYAEAPAYGFNTQWMRGYVRNVFKKSSPEECSPGQLKSLFISMRSRYLKRRKEANPDAS